MSNAYTADGKRRSSMTHARRGHECLVCGRTVFGNGGHVAHGRAHVRRGEAVELVKFYRDQSPMRMFFDSAEVETIERWLTEGFDRVEA